MNIILSGFMGCGKTTIGKLLAQDLNVKFIDIDSLIENNVGISISEIFAKYNEIYFRDLEYEAIKKTLIVNNQVVSLGGGAITYERNVNCIKNKNSKIFFINTPIDTILYRLKSDTTRPLAKNELDIRKLFEKRLYIYKSTCNIEIDGSLKSNEIIKLIKSNIK